jgi:hypothetical protein
MIDTDYGKELKISYELQHTNSVGETSLVSKGSQMISYQPYMQKALAPLSITMPAQSGLTILILQLSDVNGKVLHRNFMHFEILSGEKLKKTELYTVNPAAFSNASFTKKQWNVLDGLKVNGAGSGYFEYTFTLDKNVNPGSIKEAFVLLEMSAKELFVKDQADNKENADLDYMLGARASPSGNPNAYPMTDEKLFPSVVSITVDGKTVLTTTLKDDPADHRGVLSWHHQLQDKKLREAGSYGFLTKVPITKAQLKSAIQNGQLTIRIATKGDGGIAIYGKSFGRYPIDPSLVMKLR